MPSYYNYRHRLGDATQLGRSFLSHVWRTIQKDPHWSPPAYGHMRSAVMEHSGHLSRQRPIYIHSLAIRRRDRKGIDNKNWLGSGSLRIEPVSEETVGLGAILHDPRRNDRAACLAYTITANQPDCLEQLLSALLEESALLGYQGIIGPTGFSFHLGSGLLVDHWRDASPLYTAYDPPYMAETVLSIMTPILTTRLFHLSVPPEPQEVSGPARLVTCDPSDLKSSLLHLFQAAVGFQPLAVDLDELEADFLLHWIDPWPTQVWLALYKERPSGFVLLQPDVSSLLKRANGGRWPWWRAWLKRAAQNPVRAGRLVFGGVLPEVRGLGLGRQLLAQSLQAARKLGWDRLSIGPIPGDSQAAELLIQFGARPRQTYQYFKWP